MEIIHGHGATFTIKQENDGWWSVYKVNDETQELQPKIQDKDREHALSYIDIIEVPRVPLQKLC